MMKIEGRLRKLEQRAKRTLRCDWCRYTLHDSPPAMQKLYAADPNSHITAFCTYCGTKFSVNVSACDEYERDATVLFYRHERGAKYRDARVFAAMQWFIHRRVLQRWLTGGLDKEKVEARKKARKQKLQQQLPEKKKDDRFTREREELRARASSFAHRMHEKEQNAFAPHTFSLAAELEAIEKPDSFGWIPGTHKRMEYEEITARKVLYHVLVIEACERVLWDTVLPGTKKARIDLDSIIQKIEYDRARNVREEEEAKALREHERETESMGRLETFGKPDVPQSTPARYSSQRLDDDSRASQDVIGVFRSGYADRNDD